MASRKAALFTGMDEPGNRVLAPADAKPSGAAPAKPAAKPAQKAPAKKPATP